MFLRIKKLYSFILKTFFPLLLATFSVCLFVLLMQFLWQYVNDMVGKGVSIGVLAELFFYAALTLTPMALPLSILLASLMTFGNLGEKLELLAMKASGISLLKIMKPLCITAIVFVCISFYFQNNILPKAQTRMYTIILSLRQKSPELDIPEGVFYKEITGYNVYVRHKDKKNGLLLNLMIYDYSKGFENAAVIVADSGKLSVSEDKTSLVLNLHNGESFENLGTRKTRSVNENVPYRRETFRLKTILIPFDTNFSMVDESIMGNRDLGKNVSELTVFIDSLKIEKDSIDQDRTIYFKDRVYINAFKQNQTSSNVNYAQTDSLFRNGFQAYFDSLNINIKLDYINKAKLKVSGINNDYGYISSIQADKIKLIKGHQIQLQKKLSMSLACLLFFFIGAPLGAIIRKGGLGMPVVLSVFLFLLNYTIDTFGLKMAKQGVWEVWEGMWLSSAVLAPLGVLFTYKAVNDSVMMNPDAWKIVLQSLFGKREIRNYAKKEVIMTLPDYGQNLKTIETWNTLYEDYVSAHKKKPSYITFWKNDLNDKPLKQLVSLMNYYIEDLQNSDKNLIIAKLMDYPVIKPFNLKIFDRLKIRLLCAVIFPIGLIGYIVSLLKQRQVNNDLEITYKVNKELKAIINVE
jgi:lipopolysaccharide export system permease protein